MAVCVYVGQTEHNKGVLSKSQQVDIREGFVQNNAKCIYLTYYVIILEHHNIFLQKR